MPTPSVAEETIAEAYELGRRQIRERSPLGGAEPAQFFAMPAAIVLASGGDWLDEAPAFKELPESDRYAMRIIYETIFELDSPEVRYSTLMGEILDLRINFFGKLYRVPIACDPVDWTQNDQNNWKYWGKHLLLILKYARKKFATRRRKKTFVSASKATGVGDLAWLAESRDPDLWHLIAAHANPDLLEKFVGWVIQQPECDRATAAYLFLKLGGPSCFLNPPSGPISSWSFVCSLGRKSTDQGPPSEPVFHHRNSVAIPG
jgi:hypothetical protein